MASTKKRLAKVDVGEGGMPGEGASKIIAEVYMLGNGRYEVKGWCSFGTNQGYFQENYSYGEWRGRGGTLDEARRDFLETVPSEYRDDMARASKEAIFEAEDMNQCKDF